VPDGAFDPEKQLPLFAHYLRDVHYNDNTKLSDKYQITKTIWKILEFGAHSHNSFSKKVDELLIENKIIDKIITFYNEFPKKDIILGFVTNILVSIFQNYHFQLQNYLLQHNIQEFIIHNFRNDDLKPYLAMISGVINHMCTYRKRFQEVVCNAGWNIFCVKDLDSTLIENQLKFQYEIVPKIRLAQQEHKQSALTEDWKSMFFFFCLSPI
jgi:hypothetical protein